MSTNSRRHDPRRRPLRVPRRPVRDLCPICRKPPRYGAYRDAAAVHQGPPRPALPTCPSHSYRARCAVSPEERFRDLAAELAAAKPRVRHVMSRPHGPTDGHFKEDILRQMLARKLPRRYVAGSGFIVGDGGESSQIDILIYDSEAPLLEQYGDVVHVTPDAVRGIIEVKATARQGKMAEAFEKLAHTARIAAGIGGEFQPDLPFVGLFAYDVQPGKRVPTWVLTELREGQAKVKGPPITHVCLGSSYFVHYWGQEPGTWGAFEPYRRWHLYKMKDLAPGYFVSNVIEWLATQSVHQNRTVWYPEESKEVFKIDDIERAPYFDPGA